MEANNKALVKGETMATTYEIASGCKSNLPVWHKSALRSVCAVITCGFSDKTPRCCWRKATELEHKEEIIRYAVGMCWPSMFGCNFVQLSSNTVENCHDHSSRLNNWVKSGIFPTKDEQQNVFEILWNHLLGPRENHFWSSWWLQFPPMLPSQPYPVERSVTRTSKIA